MSLFHKQHRLGADEVSRGEPVHIHSACKAGCIKVGLVPSGGFSLIDQHGHFSQNDMS